ncbi:hypothetical protein ACW2Q0_10165 [Nocardia sp. R16R-3T]
MRWPTSVMIAERLAAAAQERGRDSNQLEKPALPAIRSVFGAPHPILARTRTGAHPGGDAVADPHDQITQIVAGFFAAPTTPMTSRADCAPRRRRLQ